MCLGLGYAGDARGPNLKLQLLLLANQGYLRFQLLSSMQELVALQFLLPLLLLHKQD